MKQLDYMITQQHHAAGPPTSQIVPRPKNFVAALPMQATAVAKRMPPPAPSQEMNYTIDVPLQSTQQIVMKTTAVDRAQGFAIKTQQLGLIIGFAVTVASVAFVDVPVFSFWSLTIYVLTYAAVWLYAYYLDLKHSPEGIARNESDRKWGVIERHQDRMWDHYDRMIQGDNE